MPDRATHNAINRILLGKDYDWVSELMDAPAHVLGPHHRKVFHDQETALLIFMKSGGDFKALLAAEAHIAVDTEFSRSSALMRRLLFPRKAFKRRRR